MFDSIISSHTSRAQAREAAKKVNGAVVRAGHFGNGSFGLYARTKANGQYIGGPNPLILVWHVVKKGAHHVSNHPV